MSDAPANHRPSPPRFGFAVLYRWRVDPAKEQQFVAGWELMTTEICRHSGGLGSRLHKASDGTWVAYAQWPDRQTWEQANVTTEKAEEAATLMKGAIEERFAPIELELVADLLVLT